MPRPEPIPDRDPQTDGEPQPDVRVFRPDREPPEPMGVGGLFGEALEQPVQNLARAEELKAAICARLRGACPDLTPWVAMKAAELVIDGGCEPRTIGRVCSDFAAVRRKTNPPGLMWHLLTKHFGQAWTDWGPPPKAE